MHGAAESRLYGGFVLLLCAYDVGNQPHYPCAQRRVAAGVAHEPLYRVYVAFEAVAESLLRSERLTERIYGGAERVDFGYQLLQLAFRLGDFGVGVGDEFVFVAQQGVKALLFGQGGGVLVLERGVLALYSGNSLVYFGYALVDEFLFCRQRAHALLYIRKILKGVHDLFAVLIRHVFVVCYFSRKRGYLGAEPFAYRRKIGYAGGVLFGVVAGALYLPVDIAYALGGIGYVVARLRELLLDGVGFFLEHLAFARCLGYAHRVADALVVELLQLVVGGGQQCAALVVFV